MQEPKISGRQEYKYRGIKKQVGKGNSTGWTSRKEEKT